MQLRHIILSLLFLILSWAAPSMHAGTAHVRQELSQVIYHIHPTLTYDVEILEKATLLTRQGLRDGQRSEQTYFPKTERLQLLEAYVNQPDGSRVEVTKNNIFTRPSQASQDAPGFTNSLTTTVVFPQLRIGSQVVVHWKLEQIKPEDFGVNIIDLPDFLIDIQKEIVEIHLPSSVPLHWAKEGPFKVTDTTDHGERVITATLLNKKMQASETRMVSPIDVSPLFVASTLPSWEAIGSIYWKQSKSKVVVTPEIQAAAKKIIGTKTGLSAATALYNWVVKNIHYVAVYLNQSDGHVPHTAEEVLHNGYGDCKDHVVLLQALLQAVGIQSLPVIVSWGEQYKKFPIPSNAFNHLIIYIPQYHLFANPTDPFSALGTMDTLLSGKFAVIASDKPKTIELPNNKPSDHIYRMESHLTIMPDGSVVGSDNMQFSGRHAVKMRRVVNFAESTKQLAEMILADTPEGGSGEINASNPNDLEHPFIMKGSWKSPSAIVLRKEALFSIPIGIDPFYIQQLRQLITSDVRTYPIIVGASDLSWNYHLTIPSQYRVKLVPENISLTNSAGSYTSHYQVKGQTIIANRSLKLVHNVCPVKQYPDLLALLYQPLNDVRSVIVLEKTESTQSKDTILKDYLY